MPYRVLSLLVLLAAALPGVLSAAVDLDEWEWHDARTLTLEGQGWAETAAPYDRLPARAEERVRGPVWRLSRDAAGLVVRFRTDATRIAARWTLTRPGLAMRHMSATGVSGLDLYVRTDAGWRWLGVGMPTAQENTATLAHGLEAGQREYQLYLPLYNGVASLELGVPPGTSLSPLPRAEASASPLVFYGTSITQGACASRPGMAHVAILGRTFDRPVINLGFSGQGEMEIELAHLLGALDAAVFVIDCLPNMSAEQVEERVEPFVAALRERRPTTPILFVEDRSMANAELLPAVRNTHVAKRRALREGVTRLHRAGVGGLSYLEGDGLLGDDGEGAVDGSHPNDLGFVRQARAFAAALTPLLDPRAPR